MWTIILIIKGENPAKKYPIYSAFSSLLTAFLHATASTSVHVLLPPRSLGLHWTNWKKCPHGNVGPLRYHNGWWFWGQQFHDGLKIKRIVQYKRVKNINVPQLSICTFRNYFSALYWLLNWRKVVVQWMLLRSIVFEPSHSGSKCSRLDTRIQWSCSFLSSAGGQVEREVMGLRTV